MIFPKREKIDATKNAVFSSEPFLHQSDVPEEFHALKIQLGNSYFVAYTIDPDFSINPKRFEGEIRVMYDQNWATRMDMLKLGRVQIIFLFPKQGGRRESLAVYVPKNFLGVLS